MHSAHDTMVMPDGTDVPNARFYTIAVHARVILRAPDQAKREGSPIGPSESAVDSIATRKHADEVGRVGSGTGSQ